MAEMKRDLEIIKAVADAFSECEKPAHFTNYLHCEECAEHDRVLLQYDRDSLPVSVVNNPGWDPICFASPEGKAYYMPSLVKFALTHVDGVGFPFWTHLLLHLEGDGPNNSLIQCCTLPQRRSIESFLEHLIENHSAVVEEFGYSEDLLRVHGYWSEVAQAG